MAASYISAKVIQKNDNVYLCFDGTLGVNVGNNQVGQMQAIPTPSTAYVDGDYWAVPVGLNTFSGFNFVPTSATDTNAPTPDSFHVVRIKDKESADWWYIRGVSYSTTAGNYGYVQASQDAEDGVISGARLMPTDIPPIGGRQDVCTPNSVGAYAIYLGLPTISGTETYKPFGTFNNVALPAAATNGYTSVANLLTFLNASWTNLGSPAQAIVWTATADNLTVIGTLTGGDGTDTFTGFIARWIPSV